MVLQYTVFLLLVPSLPPATTTKALVSLIGTAAALSPPRAVGSGVVVFPCDVVHVECEGLYQAQRYRVAGASGCCNRYLHGAGQRKQVGPVPGRNRDHDAAIIPSGSIRRDVRRDARGGLSENYFARRVLKTAAVDFDGKINRAGGTRGIIDI